MQRWERLLKLADINTTASPSEGLRGMEDTLAQPFFLILRSGVDI